MRKYIPHVIIAVLLVFIVYQCETGKERTSRSDANMAALIDSVTHFKNKLGNVTASKKTLQLEKKQLNDLILEKDKDLKALTKEFSALKSVVKYSSKTTIPTIDIPFEEPITYAPCDSIPRFERTGAKFTDWYSLGYKVNNEGITIEPFETWTETTVITGYKRKWFLGEQTLTTDITFSNPYIQIDNMQTIEVVVPEPIYKKWYVWLAAGAVGGFFLSK